MLTDAGATAWISVIGVIFTGLTALIGVFFAALASRDARKAAEGVVASKAAISEIHTVVNENFSKQREEIAAQAMEIANLRLVLASNVVAAAQSEETRRVLASETAAVISEVVSAPTIVKP